MRNRIEYIRCTLQNHRADFGAHHKRLLNLLQRTQGRERPLSAFNGLEYFEIPSFPQSPPRIEVEGYYIDPIYPESQRTL